MEIPEVGGKLSELASTTCIPTTNEKETAKTNASASPVVFMGYHEWRIIVTALILSLKNKLFSQKNRYCISRRTNFTVETNINSSRQSFFWSFIG